MMTKEEMKSLGRAIIGTLEVMGTTASTVAVGLMVEDLCIYPVAEVSSALARCRREIKGRLSMADIMERIPSANPYMSANEAWALALTSNDEYETVVWTDEIAAAMGDARPILVAGDKVGARMAFISSYERRVEMAKSKGESPRWTASLGQCPSLRQTAIEQALMDGRLPADFAVNALPAPERVNEILSLPPSPEEAERRARKSKAVIAEIKRVLSSDSKREQASERAAETRRINDKRRSELLRQAKSIEQERIKG